MPGAQRHRRRPKRSGDARFAGCQQPAAPLHRTANAEAGHDRKPCAPEHLALQAPYPAGTYAVQAGRSYMRSAEAGWGDGHSLPGPSTHRPGHHLSSHSSILLPAGVHHTRALALAVAHTWWTRIPTQSTDEAQVCSDARSVRCLRDDKQRRTSHNRVLHCGGHRTGERHCDMTPSCSPGIPSGLAGQRQSLQAAPRPPSSLPRRDPGHPCRLHYHRCRLHHRTRPRPRSLLHCPAP